MEMDNMKELCVKQGYVPPTCKLDGMLIICLINKGECPCDGCNHNRSECKGKEKVVIIKNEDMLYMEQEYLRRTKEIKRMIGHKNSGVVLEIQEERGRVNILELIVKKVQDEKAYTLKVRDYYKLQYILPRVCSQYKVEQIHIDSYNPCIYEIIEKLNLNNIDIVPFKYVKMNL